MGTILKMVACVIESDAREAFSRLMDRLWPRIRFHEAMIDEITYRNKSRAVSEKDLRNSLRSVLDLVAAANRHLDISASYQLSRRKDWIWLDIDFFNREFHGRASVADEGYITLSTSQGDLADWAPLRLSSQDLAAFLDAFRKSQNPTTEQWSEYLEFVKWCDVVTKDAAELFLRFCGRADGDSDPAITYACMYPEYGFLAPGDCKMIFHNRLQEIGRDVARIYAKFNWGTPMPATVEPAVDILALEHSFSVEDELIPKKWCDKYPEQITGADRERIEFVRGVSRDDVIRCARLSCDALRLLLDELESCVPNVQVHFFPDGAVALTTNPLLDLWPAYKHIVESTRPGRRLSWLAE